MLILKIGFVSCLVIGRDEEKQCVVMVVRQSWNNRNVVVPIPFHSNTFVKTSVNCTCVETYV